MLNADDVSRRRHRRLGRGGAVERAGACMAVVIKLPICYRGYQKARWCNILKTKMKRLQRLEPE